MLKVLFLGSSDFALPILGALHEAPQILVAAVATQPDRKAGRGRKSSETPVSRRAALLGLPRLKPARLDDIRKELETMELDAMVCAAYGAWLPGWLLEATPLGVVNVHPSLLPDYRGAAPVPRTILDGRDETGVTFMLTDPGWDTGPVIHALRTRVEPEETAGELSRRLSVIAASALVPVLERYSRGEMKPRPQSGCGSYAGKLGRADARLDWNRPAAELARAVRAFNPVPGAWTIFNGKDLKVFRALVRKGSSPPGLYSGLEEGRLLVGTGDGLLELLEVQPQSGRRMDAVSFLRGRRAEAGEG